MKYRNLAFLGMVAGLVAACDDVSASDDRVEFDEPQIVPQSNVLCLSLSDEEFIEGVESQHFVQLTNRGREPLIIQGAEKENDARDAFTIGTVRSVGGNGRDGVDCSAETPCSIPSTEDAVLQYFYTAPAPGWDSVDLRVLSNAQNYPRLRLFVLAKARPADLDPEVEFDPGPKPSNAVGADGTESCPET